MGKPGSSKRRRLITAVGAAIALPLIAIPAASASLSSGNFAIKATNESAGLTAIAGRYSGSSVTPGPPVDSSPALINLQCGPMTMKITESMFNKSEVNSDKLAAGQSDFETYDGSWEVITYSVDGENLTSEKPTAGTTPVYLFMGRAPFDIQVAQPVFYMASGSDCQLLNEVTAPQNGANYLYKKDSYETVEGRYVQEGGELVRVEHAVQSNGDYTLSRIPLNREDRFVTSETKPYEVREFSGTTIMRIALPEEVDGYNYIDISENSDGSRRVEYKNAITPGNIFEADRRNGPVSIDWNHLGQIISMSYRDADGNLKRTPAGVNQTTASYNTLTGQSWDGTYAKMSDFDLRSPF